MICWNTLRKNIPGRDDRLVSIIMCVHGAIEVTKACLKSLYRHEAGEEFELIIVDNSSDGQTRQLLQEYAARYATITLIRNEENLGFARGCNIGFAASRGARVVFLNNDTELSPEWLRSLLHPLKMPGIIGVQPKLVFPDGTIQAVGTVFSDYSPMGYHIYAGKPGDFEPTQSPMRFKAITAACMGLMARDFASVDGYDPAFINGQEDVDLCLRLGGGEKVFAYAPDSVIIHHEGSTPGRRDNIEHNRRVFHGRWADSVRCDDAQHYANAGISATSYEPDNPDWVEAGYAVWRPRQVRAENEQPPLFNRLAAGTTIAIKIACRERMFLDICGDYHFAVSLAAAFLRKGVRARVDLLQDWYAARTPGDINLVIRGKVRYEPNPLDTNLLWIISHPEKTPAREALVYDHVFVASNIWTLNDENQEVPFERLLQATDICRFYPENEMNAVSEQHLFVANSRGIERSVVKHALSQDMEIQIYGGLWEGLAPSEWVRADKIANIDLPAYYVSADVVLNDHWEWMRIGGFVSNRVFDVLACGGNLVTDRVEGMPREIARFCTFFDNEFPLDDALRLAKETNTSEKRQAAASYVPQHHSFDQRAGVILKSLAKERHTTMDDSQNAAPKTPPNALVSL